MRGRLENKNIIVTAAGQGIGRATAMAKENFNSWEEFGKSMIIGFTIDMFKRKDIDAHYLEDSVRIYKLTVTDPTSPWNTIEWQK